MNAPRRSTSRVRTADNERPALTGVLLWSIGILLLISAAVASWIGSFYIFGHPEEPFSYKVLQALRKVDPPKRFELTAAPRGEFLSPEALVRRFGEMTPLQLEEANAILLRNYIRNYQQTKDPVPYVIGRYVILDSYELGPDDFFPSGVVAIARAQDDPLVLLEHVFTAPPKAVTDLSRMLLTGLELNLQRRMDLSAVVHVDRLPDGRLKFTALPIVYGSYASTQGPGTFSLEPPASLNVDSGLPVIRSARLEAATEKYASFRRRAGLPPDDPGSLPGGSSVNQLLRVQRPEPVEGEAPPIPEETPAVPPGSALATASPSPDLPLRVLPALPVEPAQAVATPTTDDPPGPEEMTSGEILGDLPPEEVLLSEEELAAASPTPTPSPTATPTPTEAIANVAGRNWQVYAPGQMPRGRLVPLNDVSRLADSGVAGERLYLQGSFVVTAASNERAVLRSQSALRNPFGGSSANVRIIVDFPTGADAPAQGQQLSRDGNRPFLITNITRGEDGQINVQAREITRP